MFQLFKTSIVDSSLLTGAVDNHSHILYGVDDGVSKAEESLQILDWLEGEGLAHLWLTPHIMEDVPNTTSALKERFSELSKLYRGSICLHLAAEYMLDNLYAARLRSRDLLLHGENMVLVETSAIAPPMDFWELIQETMSSGYWPVLAHPERYAYMSPEEYARLHEMGVMFQLNLPSAVGYYGPQVKARAEYLLERGWYCMFGSDCHRFRNLVRQYSELKFSQKLSRRISELKTPHF